MTILEFLVVVGALAVFAAVGFSAIRNIRGNTDETKLSADITTVNEAVKGYIFSGGEISSDATAEQVIELLKLELSDEDAAIAAGYSGSFLDHRMIPLFISSDEDGPRAIWNFDSKKFVKTNANVAGIKQFVFDELAEKSEFHRIGKGMYKFADDEKGWVWNHGQDASNEYIMPTFVSRAPNSGVEETPVLVSLVPTGEDPPMPEVTLPPLNPDPLAAPKFSKQPGEYSISRFDLPVAIINMNPASISKIFYSVDFGNWAEYSGPVLVPDGGTLRAQAISTSPKFTDSSHVDGTYNGIKDTAVFVTSTKDLSNVVLEYIDGTHQKFDNLTGYTKTFVGNGTHIVGVWIKSGKNASGDGPGYGERILNPGNGNRVRGNGKNPRVSATFLRELPGG